MAIIAGDIIKASDVSAAFVSELGALSVALASPAFNHIFTQEISGELWGQAIPSSVEIPGGYNTKVKFLENLKENIIDSLDEMHDKFDVLSGKITYLSGYGDMILSCFSLASNIRDTTIFYEKNIDSVVQNGMYLKSGVINRDSASAETDIAWNLNDYSTNVYTDSTEYLNNFKDVSINGKKIFDLSGGEDAPLSVGKVMVAKDAMDFLNFLASMNRYISSRYDCMYGEDAELVTVIYHQSYLFGNGGDIFTDVVIDKAFNVWRYVIRDESTLPDWHLSSSGFEGGLKLYGWTTDSEIVTNPTKVWKDDSGNYAVDYVAGQSVSLHIEPDEDGRRILNLYPVVHGYFDWPDGGAFKISPTTDNTKLYDFLSGAGDGEITVPSVLANDDIELYATFKYFYAWHNERNHTHTSSLMLDDGSGVGNRQRITTYTGNTTSYQCFYTENPNLGTVTSEFRYEPFWRVIPSHNLAFQVNEVLRVRLTHVPNTNKFEYHMQLIFPNAGSNGGEDECNGQFVGLRIFV